MIRLLSSELLRARSRRLVKVLLIVGVLGTLVGVTIGAFHSHKITATSAQEAMQRCLSDPTIGFGGMTKQRGCRESLDNYLPNAFDVNHIGDLLRGTSINLIVIGWLVGASLAGAEWAAGTMTTLLTWEPRRIRVLLAKLAAAIITVLVLTLALQLLLAGALWVLAATRGANIADPGLWSGIFGSMFRVSALSAIAGVFGMAIAMYTRSVTAAMASGFIYLAVIEGLIRGYRPGLAHYLIGDNAAAWVNGRPFRSGASGIPVTPVHGAVVLLIYAAILVGAAALSFRGRDVT